MADSNSHDPHSIFILSSIKHKMINRHQSISEKGGKVPIIIVAWNSEKEVRKNKFGWVLEISTLFQ